RVEAWGAALVDLGGNHRPDAASSQRCPHGVAAVALVADQSPRAQPWSPTSPPLDGAALRQRGQRGLVVALATGQGEDDRLALPLGPQVDFGGEPTPRAAERFGRRVPPFAPAAC
ncbi:MAG: hypothetical protein JWO59_3195, partial [Chloroflexi bacterium]|nr:hypothetical protein [Chloroflexota bacterium]